WGAYSSEVQSIIVGSLQFRGSVHHSGELTVQRFSPS
ncbi:hypothetical protein LEMLEM_LOCUS21361, partial [Lemmus lemmus]